MRSFVASGTDVSFDRFDDVDEANNVLRSMKKISTLLDSNNLRIEDESVQPPSSDDSASVKH